MTFTSADLNGTHQGKTITFISPEGWEVTGIFYNVEHYTSHADITYVTDAGPRAVKCQGASILEIGPFELNMTGTETVRVHSSESDRPDVVRLEVNLSRSVADALQESARLRGASLTEAIRQAIVLLHKADPPVETGHLDPLVAGIAEVFGVDPANISNAEQRTVGNRRVLRWTERMVTNGNVTWATRAAGTAGRVEFGGDTGLSISEALKAATEEAESLARQMVAPGEVQA